MPQSEQFEVLVLGSGTGGKLIAWHMARSGQRTAVVERRWVGGSCPNIACMPSKNEISSAKVAHVARHGREYGTVTDSVTVNMATVRRRKHAMVERQVAKHLPLYRTSGAELIMGRGRFVAPKTLEVNLNGGGVRQLAADKVFLNVGTHAAIPNVPGLHAAQPLTHVEALELDYVPRYLIVIGGGYSGLELAQAFRRFGSDMTIIESQSSTPGARGYRDVSQEIRRILSSEGYSSSCGGRIDPGEWAIRRQGFRCSAHRLRRAKRRLLFISFVAIATTGPQRIRLSKPIDKADRIDDWLYLPEILYVFLLITVVSAGARPYNLDALILPLIRKHGA
jgi:Pyridine nucleotide-disulphide oxidoreductase